MDQKQARTFLRQQHRGTLATLKTDGRPQLSLVSYLYDADDTITISTTKDRAKTRNIRREPRVSLLAQGEDWRSYVVAEGTAQILTGEVLPELRRVYEAIAGKPHPDWAAFDAAMVQEQRVFVQITIARLYPLDQQG